jgi:hypothetical protein
MAVQKRAGKAQFQDLFEVVGIGKFNVANFTSAATGSGTFATSGAIAVAGAAFGDLVLVGHSIDLTDGVMVGTVTAASVVEVILLNNTAGALDFGSVDLTVVVLRVNPAYAVI